MTTETKVEPRFYTVREAATIAGISYATMRRLVDDGAYTARKIGGQWRLPKDTFDREVAGNAA